LKKLPILLILVLVIIFANCDKNETTNPEPLIITDLLIKDNEISGWSRSGSSWLANSSGDLNNAINGEAVIYTSRGSVEAAMQEYEGSILGNSLAIELRVFDQASSDNALAVFDELANQMSNPVDWNSGVGEEALIERFPTFQKIIFWKYKYFIQLYINSGLDESLEVLKTFANNIDTKIP